MQQIHILPLNQKNLSFVNALIDGTQPEKKVLEFKEKQARAQRRLSKPGKAYHHQGFS
jgi:hypothetical protein